MVIFALFMCSGCAATLQPPSVVHDRLDAALRAAWAHHEAGRESEAAQLLAPVLDIDPAFPGAAELNDVLGPGIENLFDHPYLGSNFAKRPATTRPLGVRLLLYLPDRLLDLTDLFSLDVHLGLGAFVNLHFTRAAQLGAGARGVGGVGWHDHRSLGFLGQAESGIVIPGIGAQAFSAGLVGTSGVFAVSDAAAGVHGPSARVYREFRDYWALGVAFTAGVAGAELDMHPIEFADFVVGIAGFDLLNDDFARTRGLALTQSDRVLLRRVAEIQRSPETLERYRSEEGKESAGAGAAVNPVR